MKTINIFSHAGGFAENKDVARDIRTKIISPSVRNKEEIILDFQGVESTTQSFIHALISEVIRENGDEVLEKMTFKNCSQTVQKIIGIVVEYMQQSS